MTSRYTYNKNSQHFPSRFNHAMDYLCRHLEGVTVTFECGDWVQIKVQNGGATEAIDALWDGNMMEIYPNMCIREVMEMLNR